MNQWRLSSFSLCNIGRGAATLCCERHVSKKRKRNHKAVEKNIKAKELMLKRRQRQLKVVKKPEVIDVDKYQPSQKTQNEKFWIRELNLLERDRDILLNPAHVGSSALAVRGGTTQSPASIYHIATALSSNTTWYCNRCSYIRKCF